MPAKEEEVKAKSDPKVEAEPKDHKKKASDLISVKAVKPERVGIWEVNPAHPDGEVFVSGDKEVEVAKTAAVMRAIADNRLVQV